MRRILGAILIGLAALPSCGMPQEAASPVSLALTVRPLAARSPSPLVEASLGRVRAVFPRSWHAQVLPHGRPARQGFVASPNLERWRDGVGGIPGIEAFWVDVNALGISADYYYLAARATQLGNLSELPGCEAVHRRTFVDHPPDLTGRRYSPADYIVTVQGRCLRDGLTTRWASIVAAPGFGPAREVGIPTSGLYVVVAQASGPRAAAILHEMLAGTRFGGTPIEGIVAAASRAVSS